MGLKDITDPEAIKLAIAEYDRLGEKRFLAEYGFQRAKGYILWYRGRPYPSKAIVGVAHKYQFPEVGPLTSQQFSGGEAAVQPKLERLGFTVRGPKDPNRPIVLTENEVTFGHRYDHWKDVTGERYHFPNSYINRMIEGRPFIYYKGVRRRDGRGKAEYTGFGQIGPITRDPSIPSNSPKSKWTWYAEIVYYTPFSAPVPAKINDEYFETTTSRNHWRVAVREISVSVFERILRHAGLRDNLIPTSEVQLPEMADIKDVDPEIVSPNLSLMITGYREKGQRAVGGIGGPRSPYAKKIGDRAEEVVHRYLLRTLLDSEARTVRWIAQDGETPGWDIEYTDGDGRLVAIEVKGTRGAEFYSVEVTAKEWDAAQNYGDQYWLYLVSRCCDLKPTIETIQNPFALKNSGQLLVTPTHFRVVKIG